MYELINREEDEKLLIKNGVKVWRNVGHKLFENYKFFYLTGSNCTLFSFPESILNERFVYTGPLHGKHSFKFRRELKNL